MYRSPSQEPVDSTDYNTMYRSPSREPVDSTDYNTGSSSSDSGEGAEFKQVRMHAQNQIILSKVLSEEREQVSYF